MASNSGGNTANGPKQGIQIIIQNALLATPQTALEDEANSEAEVEPGSSSDSMNVSSSTRVSVPGKIATSAFEIIAVEMQPDSASSPGNGNLHHSSLSLGGVTNDTDQEQDFQMQGNRVASEEGLATESESEVASAYLNVDQQRNDKLHLSPPKEIGGAAVVVNTDALITTTSVQLPAQSTVTVAPPMTALTPVTAPPATLVPVPAAPAAPAPGSSISTIKTETGREITILKVEAEFRRGRWQCSDYHDHRDTSPPPPNPSPASNILAQNLSSAQSQVAQQQQAPSHLPVLSDKQQQQSSVMSTPPVGLSPMSLQQPRPPQQQQNYSTQQMVEKTAAALSRALSTENAGYPGSVVGSFTGFSGHTTPGMAAPVMMQAAVVAPQAVTAGPAPGMTDLAAIEVKVAQALDLVKKYLMAAVRHELEEMQGEVMGLQTRLDAVQRENELLRANVPDDVLQNLLLAEPISSAPVPQMMQQQPQTMAAITENPVPVSMATPSSPSLAGSSTSPSNNLPLKTSTVNVAWQPQQYYNTQRERSPSANSVEVPDPRLSNNGEGPSGVDDSSDTAIQT